MKKPQYIIVHPANEQEKNVTKAFLNSLKIKFQVVNSKAYNPVLETKIQESEEHYKKIKQDVDPTKGDLKKNIKTGLREVRLFQKGKLKTTSAKDFLNEL